MNRRFIFSFTSQTRFYFFIFSLQNLQGGTATCSTTATAKRPREAATGPAPVAAGPVFVDRSSSVLKVPLALRFGAGSGHDRGIVTGPEPNRPGCWEVFFPCDQKFIWMPDARVAQYLCPDFGDEEDWGYSDGCVASSSDDEDSGSEGDEEIYGQDEVDEDEERAAPA